MYTNKHNKIETQGGNGLSETGSTEAELSRRPYSCPRVLSSEALEAVAAVCESGEGGLGPGKSVPLPCGTLGS